MCQGGDDIQGYGDPVNKAGGISRPDFGSSCHRFKEHIKDHGYLENKPNDIGEQHDHKERKKGGPPVVFYKVKGFADGVDNRVVSKNQDGRGD